MGKLERAKLYELDSSPERKKVDENGIDVCFNPKEYSLDKTVTWEAKEAWNDAPVQEFKKPSPMTMSVTLQFDTYEERVSVREKYVRKIEKMTLMRSKATSDTDVSAHSPPLVLFVWGRLTFQGVIESLSQKYTMFLADGTPVRAEVSLKIRNAEKSELDAQEEQAAASAASSGGGGRSYTVQAGDRLDMIAAKMYGNSGRWPEIASANGIDDPTKLTTGQTLSIPE